MSGTETLDPYDIDLLRASLGETVDTRWAHWPEWHDHAAPEILPLTLHVARLLALSWVLDIRARMGHDALLLQAWSEEQLQLCAASALHLGAQGSAKLLQTYVRTRMDARPRPRLQRRIEERLIDYSSATCELDDVLGQTLRSRSGELPGVAELLQAVELSEQDGCWFGRLHRAQDWPPLLNSYIREPKVWWSADTPARLICVAGKELPKRMARLTRCFVGVARDGMAPPKMQPCKSADAVQQAGDFLHWVAQHFEHAAWNFHDLHWLKRRLPVPANSTARFLPFAAVGEPRLWLNGSIFSDYGTEGRVPWALAQRQATLPLVIAWAVDGNLWWKPLSKANPPLATRISMASGSVMRYFIFAVDSLESMQALWSHSSRDDCFAIACIAANADPEGVLAAWCASPPGSFPSATGLSDLADAFGWVYTQYYGGGADEHSAMFVSRRPDDVLWVRDFIAAHADAGQIGAAW